jgi:hypothetical protein
VFQRVEKSIKAIEHGKSVYKLTGQTFFDRIVMHFW